MADIKVVRMQEIAAGKSTEEISQLLRDATERDIDLSVDLAPACTMHDGSQIAIVKFSPRYPGFLQAMAADVVGTKTHDISFGSGFGAKTYAFDKHFHGLTQLYPSRREYDAAADIVAVTGLNGRAFDSWRSIHPNGDMWLQTFFKTDLPTVRTMIYGYNTKWDSPGTGTTRDFVLDLNQALQNARPGRSNSRPLIFIGHSYGAIIVSQLLMDWKYKDTDFAKAALQATKAIFLYGAPHRGMDIDDIVEMVVAKKAYHRMELLQSLGFNNKEHLASEVKRLGQISNMFKIYSFRELHLSQRLEMGELKFDRTGVHFDYVPESSSTAELPHFLEEVIPVHANHSEMVKISRKSDQTYATTLRYIRQHLKLPAPESSPVPVTSRALQLANIRRGSDYDTQDVRDARSVSSRSESSSDRSPPTQRMITQYNPSQVLPDPLTRDKYGQTQLHYAAAWGTVDDLEPIFLRSDSSILTEVDNSGKTPLHIAARNGNTTALSWILSNLPNPKEYILQKDNEGNNLLDLARIQRQLSTVRFLQRWLEN